MFSGGEGNVSAKSALVFGVLVLGAFSGCVGESPPPPSEVAPSDPGSDDVSNQQQPATDESSPVVETQVESSGESIELDEAVGKLLTDLGEGETEVRIAASTALNDQVAEVIAQHRDWMRAGSVAQRRGMMLMMTGKAQGFPEETFSLVKLALVDGDSKVRSIGVQLIRQLSTVQAAELHPRLLTMMKDNLEESGIRNSILRLIALVPGDGLATETALGELILADDDDSTIKQAALQSYVKLAPVEPAIATLISVLDTSDNNGVKRTTAVLLGKYGSKAKAGVKQLGALLDVEDKDLQGAAAQALARIGSPSIDVLVMKLDSPNRVTRQIAIYTLGVIGPSARDHVRRLEQFITEKDPDTSSIAKEAILNILK